MGVGLAATAGRGSGSLEVTAPADADVAVAAMAVAAVAVAAVPAVADEPSLVPTPGEGRHTFEVISYPHVTASTATLQNCHLLLYT